MKKPPYIVLFSNNDMIIVRITGGLGNQLFQYAVAIRLAYRHKIELKLDITEYDRKKHRVFLLDKFNISAEMATQKEIQTFLKFSPKLPELIQPHVHKWLCFIFPHVLYERHFHFDETIMKAESETYLIGFWQSEKYFLDIEKVIRKEITLKEPLSPRSQKVLEEIKKTNSVAINVRRGDYLSDPRNFKRHGVLSLSYYENAIEYITKKVKNPVFYIFSDDLEWVKQYMRPDYTVRYMDFNYPNQVYEDLIITSKCKHVILANSTFSWWAAWLNTYEMKIAIAPKQWFKDPALNTKDLFPQDWILI